MDLTQGGVRRSRDASLLTEKAAQYLAGRPADVVELIGHVCNLPGAPRVVAEHMAQAIFAGRPEFKVDAFGTWSFVAPPAVAAPAPLNIRDLSYVVVDVETTGGLFPSHRITEIAAVVVRNGQIDEVFETLVNPERPIPPFITRLTRITWEMVRDQPRFYDVAERLLSILEGNVFAAHNAAFDWQMVSDEVRNATGAEIAGQRLCTVRLAKKLIPGLSRRSLDHVARYYGVEITRRHRAGGDAVATARCLIRMLDAAEHRGCRTLADLERLMRGGGRTKRKKRNAFPSPVTRDTTA